MASHGSAVDDPEKHFLGNLLDDDPCYSPPPLNEGSSSSPGAIPPVSVISGVGPISTTSLLRSYWPEPPPPYSPPIQTQWYRDETQPFGITSPSDYLFTSGQPPFITQPQIHHHHHSLHHHTHTHNVVENHHHYPITTVSVPSQGYGVNIQAPAAPSFSGGTADGSSHIANENSGKIEATKTTPKEVMSKSAAPTTKPPLSYRDVAARIDQTSHSDGNTELNAKKTHFQHDFDNRSCGVKGAEALSSVSGKSSRVNRDRKPKSAQPIEFQRITRKKVVANKDNKVTLCDSSSLPLVERSSTVDTSTKYEVLQSLPSKTAKNSAVPESTLVSECKREPMRVAMVYNERSRSSSVLPRSSSGTVIDVVARPKRTIDIIEKKKQGATNAGSSSQQRRRAIRKREFGWVDKTVVAVSKVSFWVEFVLKWILNLVADVCVQVYDVVSYSITYTLESIQSSLRRLLVWMNTSILSVVTSVRQVDMRRLLRFHEPESLIWGLEENMLLPTTGEEALERFLLMPRCQDAYGVLGLKASCTEEDVRRHFKRLNSLLNPNKNMLEGAEEAHELVMKAYQAISTPESRKAYNFTRIHPYKNVLHHEIGELWDRIRDRVEEARNSMYCDCGRRHLRVAVDIRQNEARYCRRCKVRHPARSNDIWVESRLFGLLWVYFTCCDGVVYDITEWATCEVNYLKHVRPNSHTVQYRLVSPARSASEAPSQKHHNEKMRELSDVGEELRVDWGHAQVSYLPLEPRDEDRSRRAANRRQKKWR
ncbi:hypothetical protein Q1695_011281 [Nippostrongylus brasiliensis]|nr:hypothetical protein Q1695_011281 [Nippostrongylus brasiliensis]